MSDEINERLAEAMAEHTLKPFTVGDTRTCACGETIRPDYFAGRSVGDAHRAHVAAALRPTVDALLAEARREVVELSICEVPHIALRVGPTYRFYALEGCDECESRVADYPDQVLTKREARP